jgi:hypothetical protein
MTRVEFALLWLVGFVYFFISPPAGMTPFPVAAGWIIIGTTIFSLIVLGKRFPMFGLFLLIMITSLMRGGRRAILRNVEFAGRDRLFSLLGHQ